MDVLEAIGMQFVENVRVSVIAGANASKPRTYAAYLVALQAEADWRGL